MGREYMLPHIHSPSCQGASWWNADDGNLSPSPLQHLLLLHLLQPNSLLLLLFTPPHLHIYPFIHPFFCISKKKWNLWSAKTLLFSQEWQQVAKKYETQPILQTFKASAPGPECVYWKSDSLNIKSWEAHCSLRVNMLMSRWWEHNFGLGYIKLHRMSPSWVLGSYNICIATSILSKWEEGDKVSRKKFLSQQRGGAP